MNYKIRISEVNKSDSKAGRASASAKAYATVVFGDSLVVRNIAIVEKKDGQGMFVSMPSQRTSEVDEYNNPVYKDIVNPITSEFQQEFSGAILEAYEQKKAGTLDKDGLVVGDGEGAPEFSVSVTPYEREGSNIRGLASIYLEDSFVINSVSIVNGRNGEFVSMPAYKASTKAKAGESLYRDIVYPITKEFREQLHGELLNVYHEKKEQQIKEAKENVGAQDKPKQKERENLPFR